MIKKYISIVALSVLSAGLLIGCGKSGTSVQNNEENVQNQDNTNSTITEIVDSPDVFVATETKLEDTSPLLQSYLFTSREEMLNSMKWFAMTETDISFDETKEYSEIKDLTFGTATLLKAKGLDKMEGSELLASRADTTNPDKIWNDAFEDFTTTYTMTIYSQTKAAKTLFGSKITSTPYTAIAETFGNPTTVFVDDGDVMLTYTFEDFSCVVTVFKLIEGDEHNKITVCVQRNFF